MAGAAFDYVLDASKSNPVETWTDVYFRQYSRWNANSFTTHDYKYWWFQGGTYGYFVDLTGEVGAAAPHSIRITDPAHWADWLHANFPDGYIHNDKWYLIEMRFRIQGSGNYVVQFWIDNQLVLNQAVANGMTPGNSFGWESNTNAYDTLAGWVYNHWQDGFAVSHTRVGPASLIEIGNNANYATATKVYQSPEYLSDTSSQIKVNLTGLGAGPYYLWVTNNRGERSAALRLRYHGSSTLPAPSNLTDGVGFR